MGSHILTILLLLTTILSKMYNGQSYTIWTVYLFALLLALGFREHQRRGRENFINQLKSQRMALRAGGTVVIDQQLIRYNTPLTTYYINIGALFSSVQVPSQYYLSTESDPPQSLYYSLISMVFGWWHVPHGPLETLAVIKVNLSGGEKISVSELIDKELIASKKDEIERLFEQLSEPITKSAPQVKRKLPSTGPNSPSMQTLEKHQAYRELDLEKKHYLPDEQKSKNPIESIKRLSKERIELRKLKKKRKADKIEEQRALNTQFSGDPKKTS